MTDFVYTIKAHPTTYAGVDFRSRLEATWAAFFDLCDWGWQYEPIDLDGWTPDFILNGQLVEVKPVVFGERHWNDDMPYAREVGEKTLPYLEQRPIILGLSPFKTYDSRGTLIDTQIGVELHSHPLECDYVYLGQNGKLTAVLRSYFTGHSKDVMTIWNAAKNTTKWLA